MRSEPICSKVRRKRRGVAGRRVDRLQGHANVLADDLGRRAVDPGHLGAHAAPGFAGPHSRLGSQVKPDSLSTSRSDGKLLEHALGEEAQECDSNAADWAT